MTILLVAGDDDDDDKVGDYEGGDDGESLLVRLKASPLSSDWSAWSAAGEEKFKSLSSKFQSQNITVNLKRIRQRALTVTGGTGGDGWNDKCARDRRQRCRRRRLLRYWRQRCQHFLDRLLGRCRFNFGQGCCRFCSRLVGLEFWQILDFNLCGGN